MPRTPGTRAKSQHGSAGNGYGGAAKGEGRKAAGPGRPSGVKTGDGKKARSADACAPLVGDAVEVWRSVMMDAKQPAQARVSAAEKIIHRAEGATPQRIEVNGGVDWSSLTDAELAAFAADGGGDAAPEETSH